MFFEAKKADNHRHLEILRGTCPYSLLLRLAEAQDDIGEEKPLQSNKALL